MYEESFAIRSVSIDTSGWTDISGLSILPIECNTIVIFNNTGQDIFLRSDPGNALSQVTISTGQQFELQGWRWGARFPRNCNPPVSLKASSGPCSPIIESIL